MRLTSTIETALPELTETLKLDHERTRLVRHWWQSVWARAASEADAAAGTQSDFVKDLTA